MLLISFDGLNSTKSNDFILVILSINISLTLYAVTKSNPPSSGTDTPGANSSASSKILFELLNGQNSIKDCIKEVMDKMNKLVESNKNIYENNVNISQFLKGIKGIPNNSMIHTNSSKRFKNDILTDSLNKEKEKENLIILLVTLQWEIIIILVVCIK